MGFIVRDATAEDYPVFARLLPELAVEGPVLTRQQFAVQMLPNVVVLDDASESWACQVARDDDFRPRVLSS